jgi:tetratricopeptide (TPR) repeat protein
LGGVENALEPWPFYKLIVGLKAQERKIDADMVRALESLNVRYPDEYQWARWLGDVYFSRGDMTHALGVLDDAWRRRGIKGMGPRAMLLAAEAARLEGRTSQAIDILEAAHAEYPANLSVLNNLVYYMAQNPATLPRAMERLPELLSVKDSFAVIDTVAMVYLRSGQMEKAAEYMRKALTLVNKGAYAWHELYLNAAEVQIAQGDVESARKLIETVRKDSSRTSAIENRARELHQKAMKKP